MSKRIIFSAILIAAFCASGLLAQDEAVSKKIYIRAQAGGDEIKDLGYVEIGVPKASLKIMCEDEKGNVISTFILPASVYAPEESKG